MSKQTSNPNTDQTSRIFVVGCPRSGTTLLQSFLAAHPALCSVPESHVFNLIRERTDTPDTYATKNYAAFRDHMATRAGCNGFPSENLDDDALTRGFIAAMDAYAVSLDRQGWVEKTPDHLFSIEHIQRHAPNARFIHIIREPVATVASLLEAAWLNPGVWAGNRTIYWAAAKWNASLHASANWLSHGNHFAVCYEDLCQRPEKTLKALSEFLGIAFAPAMLDGQPGNLGLVMGGESWKARNSSKVSFSGDAKSKRLLRPYERWFAHSLISVSLEDGYGRICSHGRRPGLPFNPWQAWPALAQKLDQSLTWRARRRLLGNKQTHQPR